MLCVVVVVGTPRLSKIVSSVLLGARPPLRPDPQGNVSLGNRGGEPSFSLISYVVIAQGWKGPSPLPPLGNHLLPFLASLDLVNLQLTLSV